MPQTLKRLLSPVLLLLATLSHGQIEETERWYKVELMIFGHEVSDNSSEQWKATPVLAYPEAFRFLVEPDRVKVNLAAQPADMVEQSVVDEFGRQIITLRAGPDGRPDRDSTRRQQAEEIDAQATGAETSEAPPGQPMSLPTTPTPFVALPASERSFYGKAAYMQRSGRYRTLFHQAWYQPVVEERDSLPLVIDRSGDTGSWPRLQGSVKLYLSRYLHLETNLWLNTDGHYLPGAWHMPPPPLGPPSLVVEAPLPPELESAGNSPVTTGDTWPAYSGREVAYDEFGAAADPAAVDPNAVEEPAGPIYPYRHAVLLQQKRRMRSTEVHYIDHPLLGVVVTLTPLSAEELEALALTEAGLSRPED